MIRTIDEILEQSEEKRGRQELDECITKMLQPKARKVEELSPEEVEKRQKLRSLLIPKSKEIICTLIRPSKFWGLSPKLENLKMTGAAGGIGAVGK